MTTSDKDCDELQLRKEMVVSHLKRARELQDADPRLAHMEALAAVATACNAARAAAEKALETGGSVKDALKEAKRQLTQIEKGLK